MAEKTALRRDLPGMAGSATCHATFFLSVLLAYVAFSAVVYQRHVVGYNVFPIYGVVAAVALGGLKQSYASTTLSFRILTRSIIAFAVFYIVTSHYPIADTLVHNKPLARFEFGYLWMVAVGCGLLGFFRPSLGLVPLLYISWLKQQLSYVFAAPIDWLDYFTLIETGCFLIIGLLLYALFRKLGALRPVEPDSGVPPRAQSVAWIGALHPIDVLVLFAVALHFGNYFYAGLIKATLGDNPLDWTLHNRTELLVLAAWDNLVLPVSFREHFPALTYKLIANVRPVTNFLTITIQLLAVVAIVRIRWAIFITLCYDLLHLVIFATTGIFFWKFILLNLAIVAALTPIAVLDTPAKLKFALASVVLCSVLVFHILPSFAWLDTPSMNRVRLYAIADDGRAYLVPSNYFLATSVNVAQNRWIWPSRGPFPTQTWGTTRNNVIAKAAQDCSWERRDEDLLKPKFGMTRKRIEEVVRRNHFQILSMADGNGRVDYDLFPHHIFSMPWYFEAFKTLDKRRIVSYRYESEADCIGYDNGRLTKQIKFQATFDIPLRHDR
jgi:hypothetical protein